MMKTLLVAFCMLPLMLWSQKNLGFVPARENVNDWRLSSIDVNAGYRWYWKNIYGADCIAWVKDENELAASNPGYYSLFVDPSTSWNRSHTYELNLELVPGNEKRRLNLGLSYQEFGNYLASTIIDVTSTTIDTFQLDYGNGNTVPVYYDSIWSDQEVISIQERFVSVSGAYLFRTMICRVSSYIGFGSQFGISINRNIEYWRNQSWRPQYNNSEGTPIFPSSQAYGLYGVPIYSDYLIDSQSKDLKAKTVFMLTPFIPVGVEYRPFLYKSRWSGLCLEVKGKVGAEMQIIRGSKTQFRPFYGAGVGLKYHLPVNFITSRLELK